MCAMGLELIETLTYCAHRSHVDSDAPIDAKQNHTMQCRICMSILAWLVSSRFELFDLKLLDQ